MRNYIEESLLLLGFIFLLTYLDTHNYTLDYFGNYGAYGNLLVLMPIVLMGFLAYICYAKRKKR
jgi:hypothetical protein